MAYVVTFVDAPGLDREKKAAIRPAHIEYVERNKRRIAVSGGFFPEDDDFPSGGLILLDVSTRQEAVDYIENDPFFLNGIFTTYTIRRFKKFIWENQRV